MYVYAHIHYTHIHCTHVLIPSICIYVISSTNVRSIATVIDLLDRFGKYPLLINQCVLTMYSINLITVYLLIFLHFIIMSIELSHSLDIVVLYITLIN